MVRIGFQNGRLVLLPEEESKLTAGILKNSLIAEAGFEYVNDEGTFVLSGNKSTEEALEYTVGLLKEEKIPYSLDSRCQQIIEGIAHHIEELKKYRTLGREIKKVKNARVHPSGFTKTLLDSQQKAVKLHISLPFSADFSVPGSGKTWIGYAAYATFRQRGEVDKLLIAGPVSSFQPWQEEYKIIFGKEPNCVEIKGTAEERLEAYEKYAKYEIFLISYHSLTRDEHHVANLLEKSNFMMILDESHNVKQPEARRTNVVLRIAPLCKRRMILSGTPIPRATEDLYTQFAFLDPNGDIFGGLAEFDGLVRQDESLDLLKERISPFYFRIKKTDLRPRLPEPTFEVEYLNMASGRITNEKGDLIGKVEPAPHQNEIYYAIEGRIYKEIEAEEEDGVTWSEIYQLKQWQKGRLIRLLEVASNPALLMKEDLDLGIPKISSTNLPIYKKIEQYSTLKETPVKLHRVEAIVTNELDKSDGKIIIWTSFVGNINELKRRLEDFDPVVVHGVIPKDENENRYFNRVSEIKKFKNDKDCRLLIANPASLAESVSLHKNERGERVCNTAIYLDRTFNGAHYMQSLDRIHRVGLDKKQKVRYVILLADDTIDVDVNDSLDRKINNMNKFLTSDIEQFSLETNYEDVTDGLSDRDDYERVRNRLANHAEKSKF